MTRLAAETVLFFTSYKHADTDVRMQTHRGRGDVGVRVSIRAESLMVSADHGQMQKLFTSHQARKPVVLTLDLYMNAAWGLP